MLDGVKTKKGIKHILMSSYTSNVRRQTHVKIERKFFPWEGKNDLVTENLKKSNHSVLGGLYYLYHRNPNV